MRDEAIEILKAGGVGVLLTDTLYGIVGQALNKKTVQRIYKIKGRNGNKPLIILISSLDDLRLFDIVVDEKLKKELIEFWPGTTSIILPCNKQKFKYLHRGHNTLAFRIPMKRSLRNILKISGPLVAPSANPEGYPPAQNTSEAKKYFGDSIDFYISGGKSSRKPSSIIKIEKNKIQIIR